MKNIKFFALMVVATVALSCTNEPEYIEGGQKVQISLSTESTKVYIANAQEDTAEVYDFQFDSTEKIGVSYNGGALETLTLKDETTVTLDVVADNSGAHKFVVLSPVGQSNGNGILDYADGKAKVKVSNIQTIRSDMKDQYGLMPNKTNIVLYGVTDNYTSLPNKINLPLKHATAYGKVDIKNFALAEGETLDLVQIVADQNLWGTYYFNPEEQQWSIYNESNCYKAVNVRTTDLEDVWFACLPSNEIGEISVYIQTNKYFYHKTISFAESAKPLQFKAGEISRFTVDMTNALSQVVTDDAANFNPQEDEKYFIVLSSESSATGHISGDFVLRNNTCSRSPRAFQFPTVAQMGVNNFLWRIIKNDDGTFSFLSLDPTAVDGDGNYNEYLYQSDGNAQGYAVLADPTAGYYYEGGKKTYVNTFRLFESEEYSDSFYMTSTHNISGSTLKCVAYPYYTANSISWNVTLRGVNNGENDKLRVRFLKYEEGKSLWDAQYILPDGDEEIPYMIIFDYTYNGTSFQSVMTHSVTSNKMVMEKFAADSANGLYSYTRPAEIGPFSQGTLNVADDFDPTNYTWYIKRDASNPGTYQIYYKDGNKKKYLSMNAAGTNCLIDNTGAAYSQNFRLVSLIYSSQNQEVFNIAVNVKDKENGYEYIKGKYRYLGYQDGSYGEVISSMSALTNVHANIYLHKLSE
ncbi:MAG: hypothetical protein J6U53_06400 [Tidjanibacter sp.]|nr:hypothetical protein [Tidjanibacter sp.]